MGRRLFSVQRLPFQILSHEFPALASVIEMQVSCFESRLLCIHQSVDSPFVACKWSRPGSRMRRTPLMLQPADDSRNLRSFAPALLLLALALLINYVDRGNLSVAAPLLKKELGLSASQLGILFAAFFTTYTGMQFVVGWLVHRFNVS